MIRQCLGPFLLSLYQGNWAFSPCFNGLRLVASRGGRKRSGEREGGGHAVWGAAPFPPFVLFDVFLGLSQGLSFPRFYSFY